MLGSRLKNEIADLILSGEYRPGDRLDEQSLAQRFDVSRTPVREALQQLGLAGLVQTRPRRSAIVRRFSPNELQESFEAMGEVEALCARYSAERMTQAERLNLGALVEKSRDASARGDRLICRELDAKIHAALHAGVHNAALCAVADDMRMRVAVYSSAPYTLPNFETRLNVPHQEHAGIVEAVVARDADAAHRLMLDHIGQSFLTVREIVAEETGGAEVAKADSLRARRTRVHAEGEV